MKRYALMLLLLIVASSLFSQSTDGIGQVTEIENKAAEHARLSTLAEQLKTRLSNLENEKRMKLQQLQTELAEMKKQRDAELTDMKMGFYCSQCGVMKTEMEKKGENYEEHLKRVKGVSIPKGDAEIASKRQYWSEKLAVKTVQINNFAQADYGGINSVKQQIQSNTDKLNKICPEILLLSEKYEQRVIAEGKRLQPGWIDPAISAAAREHIVQDKIFIAQGKIEVLEKEFREKTEELRDKIKEETTAKQESIKQEVVVLKNQLQSLNADMENALQEIHTTLDPKLVERDLLNAGLRNARTDSIKKGLTAQLNILITEITGFQRNLQNTETSFKTKMRERDVSIKRKEDEVFALTTGLSKRQDDAVVLLRKPYDASLTEQRNIKRTQEAALPSAHTAFLTAATGARTKLMSYVSVIEGENRRMFAAANPIKCSVLTRAQLTVSTNFNTEATCMEGLRNRDRSFPSTSMECTSKSAAYVSVYRSFVSLLSDQELHIIKRSTSSFWHDAMFK